MSKNPRISFETELEVHLPPMYAVIMHNDDYTTMDFVVAVLKEVFGKSSVEANELMLRIHRHGETIVGVYVFDVAASKKLKAERIAFGQGFPLKLSLRQA